jgi:hypothetical protein
MSTQKSPIKKMYRQTAVIRRRRVFLEAVSPHEAGRRRDPRGQRIRADREAERRELRVSVEDSLFSMIAWNSVEVWREFARRRTRSAVPGGEGGLRVNSKVIVGIWQRADLADESAITERFENFDEPESVFWLETIDYNSELVIVPYYNAVWTHNFPNP